MTKSDTREVNQSFLEELVNLSGHRPPYVKTCQRLKKKNQGQLPPPLHQENSHFNLKIWAFTFSYEVIR